MESLFIIVSVVISNTNSILPPALPNSSHHPPGAVSYNVTLHQHQAPPGVDGGKAGHHSMPKARNREQSNQLEERNQVNTTTTNNNNNNNDNTNWNSSSKFPYKVYEMSSDSKAKDDEKEQREFSFRQFDRLDTLLNLSLIHRKRALYISKYLVKIGKTTIETGLKMVQIHNGNKTQHSNYRDAVKIGRRLISAGEKILSRGERVLKSIMHPASKKTPRTHREKPPSTRISEIRVVTPVIKMISLCSHGPSYYGVTLLGGIRAGHFVGHGKVDNMQACIKKCCANQECDLAFMVREDCYSVICYHKSLCRSVRAKHVKKYQPRIAHIWRGSNEDKENVSGHGNFPSKPQKYMKMRVKSTFTTVRRKEPKSARISRKHMKSMEGSKMAPVNHKEQEGVTSSAKSSSLPHDHRHIQTPKNKMTGVVQYNDTETEQRNTRKGFGSHISPSISSARSSPSSASLREKITQKNNKNSFSGSSESLTAKASVTKLKTHTKSSHKGSTVMKNNILTPNTTRQIHSVASHDPSVAAHKLGFSEVYPMVEDNNNTCPHSAIQRNVGLQHGLKTGTFSYIGELSDIKKCLEVCCHDPDCDIAFMLDQSCYTVNCTNESACRSVPYHHHQYSTKAVFVHGRFHKPTAPTSGHQRKENFGKSTITTLPTKKATSETSVVIGPVTPREDILNLRHSQKQATSVKAHHSEPSFVVNSDEENESEPWVEENIKINLTGARHFPMESKKSDSKVTNNNSTKREWQIENIKVHLLNEDTLKSLSPSVNQKSNITKPSDRIMSIKSHVDTRNKVPKKSSMVNGSVISDSYVTKAGKEIESTSVKRNRSGRKGLSTNGTEVKEIESFKIRVNFNANDGLLQGEPDYYKHAPLHSKSLDPDFYENFHPDEEGDETSAHTETGTSGSAEAESGNEYETVSTQYDTGSSPYLSNESGENYPSEGSAELDSTKGKNCSTYSYYNVTLRGGLGAGNFSFAGKVASKEDCVAHCCSTKGCDVTFVVLNRCFLVDCYSEDLCDVSEARNTNKFKPVITYVNLTIINNLLGKSLGNSSRASVNEIKGDNNTNQASNDQGEFSHIAGKNATRTIDSERDTPFLQNQDSALPTTLHQSDCIYSSTLYNISFRLGRQAGVFKNHGAADNISECAQRCCQSDHCDVAFMISVDCFFVRCHSNKSCETFSVQGSTFNPRMIFVKKHRVVLENRTQKASNSLLVNPSQSSQWSSNIPARATRYPVKTSSDLHGPTMLGPSFIVQATEETSAQHSSIATKTAVVNVKTSAPIITSIDDKEPKNAQHVSEEDPSNFVEVKTNGSEFWWQYYSPDSTHVKKSSFKVEMPNASDENSISPTIATNRPFTQTLHGTRPLKENERGLCSHAKIVNGVTLSGGYYAGIFTRHDNVTTMQECVSRCCRMSTCNVAFMVTKICYAVQCFSEEKCTSVKAHYSSKYHPQVSHVRQGSVNISRGEVKGHVKNHDVITEKLRCVLDEVSEPKYRVEKGSVLVHSTAHDLGDCAKLCCQTEGCEVALQDNGSCYSLNCHANLTCPNTNLSRNVQASSRSLVVIKDLMQSEKHPEGVHSEACQFSSVLHEVVLRGGSQSGKFKYLTEIEDMATCIRECCRHKVCDLALMLKDNCFLVSCHNEMLCDPIRSRSSQYHPQIAYKMKHGKRRHVGKAA